MNILLTGSDGFLGSKITRSILDKTDWNVLGLTLSMDLVDRMLERESGIDRTRVKYITNDEFFHSVEKDWNIYGAVHLAFSRRMRPASEIASSIDFAADVFHKLKDMNVDRVINMSSQGVYGNTSEIRTEETPPAPETQYTMAKYAAEVLFNDIMRDITYHTNFRLDPVAQSQNVLKGLVKSAKEGEIHLRGGKQVFSFIDANDVPSAVIAMLQTKGNWDPVYNVGWSHRRYTLIELADIVADVAVECGMRRPLITLDEADISLWSGMESTLFSKTTGWVPHIDIHETIHTMMTDL